MEKAKSIEISIPDENINKTNPTESVVNLEVPCDLILIAGIDKEK